MKVYIRGVNKYLKHNVNRVTKKCPETGPKAGLSFSRLCAQSVIDIMATRWKQLYFSMA